MGKIRNWEDYIEKEQESRPQKIRKFKDREDKTFKHKKHEKNH